MYNVGHIQHYIWTTEYNKKVAVFKRLGGTCNGKKTLDLRKVFLMETS